MSFEAGPSHISSSSSSSDSEDELYLTPMLQAHIQAIHAQQSALILIYANNNLLMAYHLNQEENNQSTSGGSILGRRTIYRLRADAERNLLADYFGDNPRYSDSMFRTRFRMGRSLFLRIVNAVESHDNYFMQRSDAFGRLGLSGLQKITAVFRMLAYGTPADATDEYIKIGKSTTTESLKRFCRAVVEVFGEHYLRSPNANDVARLLQIGEKRDIAPSANYVIQGKEYNTGYYLADGIYPKWSTIVQTIHDPQEGCRKDVERAFGVLQSRFAIVKGPARFWNKRVLHDIMTSCIIMHNMIIEDERNVNADIENWREAPIPEVETIVDETTRLRTLSCGHLTLRGERQLTLAMTYSVVSPTLNLL
ncbi:hypothetical protein ACOSQ3_027944 [Xanthoceras sorbifolium]